MFQSFFSDYLLNMQQMNQQWWQEMQGKSSTIKSPVNRALQEMNFADSRAFMEQALNQPSMMMTMQLKWWEQQMQIWHDLILQTDQSTTINPEKDDKRFSHQDWQQQPMYRFISQSYLLFANSLLESIERVDGLDEQVKERLTFFTRQLVNAVSPSNFVATNPELLQLTLNEQGGNLIKGLEQLREDLSSSAEILKIRMTEKDSFRLGEDLACTPGDVVYRNELFELIQYKPLTDKVNATPLLVIPPFINKYYILDLRKKNSMARWLVEQGNSVFMISWRNPGKAQQELDFEQYVLDGVVEAVKVVEQISGQTQLHAAGYCIGGTLLAATLAYYSAKRMKPRIASATYFTTLLDFSQPGEIGAFINDSVISAIEQQNLAKGYMDGRSLSVSFSLLRENSLYWNYYIDNYLKGQSPLDLDLLYWNGDSTNVTAKCHNFLLRQLYLDNKLLDPKGVKVGGVYLDLTKIKTPSYFISTKQDHIALWQACYRGALLMKNAQFVLGESGHIAGIVNHPEKNKYGFWTNPSMAATPEQWFEQATHQAGSWWTHWQQWLGIQKTVEQVTPLTQGSELYPVLEPAPGQYVKQGLPVAN